VVEGGALATNEFLTIALLGEQMPPQSSLQAVALVDDPDVDAGVSASKAYLRFINAAVGQPQLDVFQGVLGPTATRLFGMVGYGQAATSPVFDAAVGPPVNTAADAAGIDAGPGVVVDRNGYWITSAISTNANTVLTVYSSNQLDGAALAQTSQLFVAAGGIVTVALTGDVANSDAGVGLQPYQLVLCVDNGATTGLFANCSLPAP
jgi:hypothetical protein